MFALPLTKDNLDYCCIKDNETKGINDYKGVLKDIGFSPKDNNKSVFQKILCLHFLSLKTIWTTAALKTTKQKELMITKEY